MPQPSFSKEAPKHRGFRGWETTLASAVAGTKKVAQRAASVNCAQIKSSGRTLPLGRVSLPSEPASMRCVDCTAGGGCPAFPPCKVQLSFGL